MAEAIFRHKLERAGLAHRFEVDSAGVGAWNAGAPPHRAALRELQRRGVPLPNRRARQVADEDLFHFDHLIVMDVDNLNAVRAMLRRLGVDKEPRLLLEFLEENHAPVEVPDPYYTRKYDEVFDLIDRATDGLLQAIQEHHGL